MIVSPSILSADFSRLLDDVLDVQEMGAQYIHIDVMDGHFVPNISLGPVVLESLKGKCSVIKDVHLMIDEPLKYAESFKKAGADIITFHYEVVSDVKFAIKKIKELGVKVGISIKPKTDVKVLLPYLNDLDLILIMSVEPGFGGQKFMENSLPKIKFLAEERCKLGLNYLIEVDGGINLETAKLCKDNGCDIAVAGTSIFKASDRNKVVKGLLEL